MSTLIRGPQLVRMLGSWHHPVAGALPSGGVRRPEYAALATSVRGLLTDGRLALGVRLPAERELAQSLGISRTTVSAAYRELRDSGHLTSRRGAGSWTALPDGHRIGTSGIAAPTVPAGPGGAVGAVGAVGDLIDLGCAALAAPPELMAAVAEAVADLPAYTGGAGYSPMGLAVLRARVAQRYADRGLATDPDQIVITNGVQQALDLAVRLLVAPGQRVLVESPTYPNALTALAASRARVTSYALAEDGWDADLLLATLRATQARLAYLIPDFHNPTGLLMDDALRERLPAAAHAAGTDLIIDESFAELRLDGGPVPPSIARYDRGARVLTIGGMSKPFWGGLRIGWVRAAAPLAARLAASRVSVDMASSVLDQLVAVRLLDRAAPLIAARHVELAQRRDALAAALRAELPDWRFRLPAGGLSLWVELDAPVSSALARAAEELGVRIAPGPRFCADGTMERFLRLPYTLPVPDLVEAVHRLAAARRDVDRPRRYAWSMPAVVA